MLVLTVSSPKGGAGCTTLAANLAALFHKDGWRVTVCDLHAQNALRHLLAPESGETDGIGRASLERRCWREVTVATRLGVTLAPFGPAAAGQDYPIGEDVLHRQLGELCPAPRDLAILDTPAGMGLTATAAQRLASVNLVVLQADAGSVALLPGYAHGALLRPVRAGEPAQFVVLNNVDRRRRLSVDVSDFLQHHQGDRLLGSVRYDEAVPEAAAQNMTFVEEQGGSAAADLEELARKLHAILR